MIVVQQQANEGFKFFFVHTVFLNYKHAKDDNKNMKINYYKYSRTNTKIVFDPTYITWERNP